MIDTANYLPILKGKTGELSALRDLGHMQGVVPIVEIPRIDWDFKNDAPKKTIVEHSKTFVTRVSRTMTTLDTWAVDGSLLDTGHPEDSAVAIEAVLAASASSGRPALPVTGPNRSAAYNRAAAFHLREHPVGCVLRLEREDLFDPESLKPKVDAVLEALRQAPESVDLVVDFKAVREDTELGDLDLLMSTLPLLPYLSRWRTFWFAGGGFPEFLTDVEPESVEFLPRLEWTIWNALASGLHAARVPRFADYGIAHPLSPDVDKVTMNMSANIRYTSDHSWMVVKGYSVRKGEKYDQFHGLCRSLVAAPEFCGRRFSPGDAYFSDCADGVDGPGQATKWRQAGTSHHIRFVLQQIDELKADA